METFVDLWVYLSATPLFGLTATLATYVVACAFYVRVDQAAWANPVLWTVLTLVGLLAVSGTPYPAYFSGAQFIHFLLGPAVVALGVPLWERRTTLASSWGRFLVAGLIGGTAAAASAVLLGWAVGLPGDLLRSLAPKSVTAPVARGVAQPIGGVPALAAVFAVLTGLVGALSGRALFRLMGMSESRLDWMARGFAMGTSAHGLGAARALPVNADAGAYAGLALGLQVLLGSLIIPLVAHWFF